MRTPIMPRRIDPDRLKDSGLKHIAGRLQGLGYREMQTLATAIFNGLPKSDTYTPSDIADVLLAVADEIAPPGAASFHDGRGPG